MNFSIALVVFAGSALGVAVGLSMFLSDIRDRREGVSGSTVFRDELRKILADDGLDWEEVRIIAKNHKIGLLEIKRALEALVEAIRVGGDDEERILISKVKNFLHQLENEEPFQGVPDEIRIHLERIRGKLGREQRLLDPLVGHLKELLVVHSSVEKRQRMVAYVSLLTGVAGIFVGYLLK